MAQLNDRDPSQPMAKQTPADQSSDTHELRAGRALDLAISREVMRYAVSQQKREYFEATPKGTRPLRPYSNDISAAWEVAERMGATLIPINGGGWFTLIGSDSGWSSPAAFMEFLAKADFMRAGAAVSESAALSICIAALKAVGHRKEESADPSSAEVLVSGTDTQH